MNEQQEPTHDQPNQFAFEHESTNLPDGEPTPQITPQPSRPLPTPPEKPVQVMKLDRTSGVAMYIFAILSGLFIVGGSSYLISTVLRHFLVEDENIFMFFDLSSIDLYFIIATTVFGFAYFTSTLLVQKGSSNVTLGFRRRHEIVSAVWQSLLALTIVGSIITFIHAPIDMNLNNTEITKTTRSELNVTLLSASFTLVLAGLLLWSDRALSKGKNTLIPTVVSAAMIIALVVVGVVMAVEPKKDTPTTDYSIPTSTYESSSSSSSNSSSSSSTSDDSSSSDSSDSSTYDSSTDDDTYYIE